MERSNVSSLEELQNIVCAAEGDLFFGGGIMRTTMEARTKKVDSVNNSCFAGTSLCVHGLIHPFL